VRELLRDARVRAVGEEQFQESRVSLNELSSGSSRAGIILTGGTRCLPTSRRPPSSGRRHSRPPCRIPDPPPNRDNLKLVEGPSSPMVPQCKRSTRGTIGDEGPSTSSG
jgi:hypothetical protein